MAERKLPPHDSDAELSVIGGILIDNDAIHDVLDILEPNDFYEATNRYIFEAMLALHAEQKSIDFVTMGDQLNHNYMSVLMDCANVVPTSVRTREYAQIVVSHSLRRKLLNSASKVATLANDKKTPIEQVIEQSETAVLDVTERGVSSDVVHIKSGLWELWDEVEKHSTNGSTPKGISTGFTDLDRLLGGLRKTDFIIIAGRPGMGKSSLVADFMLTTGKAGVRSANFNLEMSQQQTLMRLVSRNAGIPLTEIRNMKLKSQQLIRFGESVGALSSLPVWLDHSPMTISQLYTKAKRLKSTVGLDMVTVDYLQLIDAGYNKYGSREQEIGMISRKLKSMARELDVTVIALAQLSRSCEQRNDKRPKLSDLRDSGQIEQDSDIVMFLYRDEYYNPETTDRPNIAELNVAKHRNGPTGTIDLYWHSKMTSFRNLKRQEINLPNLG
jgi:replicative DNA helicase